MLLMGYSGCSTCKKAQDYLDKCNIKYEVRDIVDDRLTEEELQKYLKLSSKEINIFFNKNGLKYKELKLKYQLPIMTDEEKIKLLSTDGMLVKRPLLVLDNNVLIGFKEKEWNEYI